MIRVLLSGLLVGMMGVGCLAQGTVGAKSYPVPTYLGDPATLGVGIQRTMTLLATSTPAHRNTVRVLFYGQSITEQDWWREVAADLKRRFPNANLIVENRALGGFSSQRLVKTAESDLYAFQPDLMIFHVYGAHTDYADIIRRTRERTTAEVMIQTDHVTKDEDLTEETHPAKLHPDGKIWNSFMNYLWLPDLARKYGCALVDQRNIWKRYLTENHLHASELLKDGVHQNAFGNYLMAEIVKAYLVRRPEVTIDPMNCATVKTLAVGKEIESKGETLTTAFDGNRVDVILSGDAEATAEVRIDGKRPSEFAEFYGFTRALSTPGGKWPVILKLSSAERPLVEDWTMRVKRDAADPKRYSFALSGSKTGEDGAGASDQRFVSRSGRVVIDPADWDVEFALSLPGIKPVPEEFMVRWSVAPHFVDLLTVPPPGDVTIEPVVTLAQGLPVGHHTLEIMGAGVRGIRAVRVYKRPVAEVAGAVR